MDPHPLQQQARRAGLLYLALAVVAPIGLVVVPGRTIVSGDAAATAELIRASETLFRIGLASELFHQALGVFVTLALYQLLKNVDPGRALQMLALSLAGIPIVFVSVLGELAALPLVRGAEFLAAFSRPEQESLAYLCLRLHAQGIGVASIFWGLWLFPFGALVIRSGFIPRVFGYLLWVAGAAYVATAFANFLLPQYAKVVGQYAILLEVAELPIVFWLVIRGARGRPDAGNPATASG